jgi:hypothetical protein
MITRIRSAPAWINGSAAMNAFPVVGKAWAEESFVRVRWGWITYMAAEILLAIVFLIVTIVYTRQLRMKVLKSSPLATLLALSDETRSTFGGITNPRSVRKDARSLKVNMVGNEMAVSEIVSSPIETGSPRSSEREKGDGIRVFTLKKSASKDFWRRDDTG